MSCKCEICGKPTECVFKLCEKCTMEMSDAEYKDMLVMGRFYREPLIKKEPTKEGK